MKKYLALSVAFLLVLGMGVATVQAKHAGRKTVRRAPGQGNGPQLQKVNWIIKASGEASSSWTDVSGSIGLVGVAQRKIEPSLPIEKVYEANGGGHFEFEGKGLGYVTGMLKVQKATTYQFGDYSLSGIALTNQGVKEFTISLNPNTGYMCLDIGLEDTMSFRGNVEIRDL